MAMRPLLRFVAGVSVMLLILTACATDDTTPDETAPTEPGEEVTTTTSPDEPEPAPESRTLVVDQSFDVVTNDPHRQFETTGTLIHNAMYDTLMSFEGTDITRPVPWLAESMEINDDATEFTFTLRNDVVFSDGTPMTSEDIAFSYQRLQNVRGNPSFLLAGVTVETPDEMTVVLRTEEPNPALPFILTNSSAAIVNAEAVRANGGTDAEDAAEADAAEAWFNGDAAGSGSGPYMLESYSDTTEIVMVANPEYWRTTPVWDRIVLRNADAATQRLNVQSGEADMVLDLAGDEIVGLPDHLTIVTSPVPQTWFVFANANSEVSEVTSNPDFWEAVRYAIDYDSVLELTGEGGNQACSIIPPMLLGSLPDDECVSRDLERAREALDRAGYEGEVIEFGFPSDFTTMGLTFGPVAERVQAHLAEAGINIELAPAPIASALDKYRDGLEEMALWVWNAGYPEPGYYLAFRPGDLVGLRAGWAEGADDEVFQLGEQAFVTLDDSERSAIYQDMERAIQAQGPFVPLFYPPGAIVADPMVGDVEFHPVYTVDFSRLTVNE